MGTIVTNDQAPKKTCAEGHEIAARFVACTVQGGLFSASLRDMEKKCSKCTTPAALYTTLEKSESCTHCYERFIF